MATLLEDRRQELMDSAPEGVDYVYLERELDAMHTRMFFVKNEWKVARISYECISRGNTEETWKQALDRPEKNDELPRRWLAMTLQSEDWIRDLGLFEEYTSELGNKFGFNPKVGCITLTPQQQEERPKLALEFLKSKLGNINPEREVQDHITAANKEFIKKIKNNDALIERGFMTPEQAAKKPEILKFEHVSDFNTERAVCEPACTCANISWGHEAGCQWKMWKDQHGT